MKHWCRIAVYAGILGLTVCSAFVHGKSSGRIVGRITSGDGRGLLGAVVTILKENQNGGTLTFTRSDKSGNYSLANIAPGSYYLQVSREGYQPLTHNNVQVESGQAVSINIILQEFVDLISAEPDPRNWDIQSVMRSTMDRRLIFRNIPGTLSDPTDRGPQFFRSGAFTVASSAGLSGENYSVYPNSGSASIASNFAFTEPVSDHARMIFSGQLNSGSDSYWRVRNTYNYRPDPGRDMKFSAAYGRLSLSAPGVGAIGRPTDFFALDPVLRDSGAEILGLGFEAKNKFLDVITVEYGMDLSRVYYGDSQNVFSPYFQLILTPSDKWTFKTGLTSRRLSDNNSVLLPDGETLNLMEPTYITKIHGDVLVSQFKHAELSVGRSLAPETAVEVAVYQDRMEGSGTPFMMRAETREGSRSTLAQLREDQTVQKGMRVAVNRKFLDFLGGSVAYVYGTGAHLDPSDPGMTSDVLARSLLNCVERSYYHMVTGRVDARMPVLRTNVTAVLRWYPGTTLTPIDLFADHADIFTKGVSFLVRQPIPVPEFMGPTGRWEALVDVRNLLNQGIDYIATSDGRIVVTRNPRSLRFGLNLNFY